MNTKERCLSINSLGEVFLDHEHVHEKDEEKTLTTDEITFMRSVHKKQAVNSGRFRVYGYTEDGNKTILVTEFIAFMDDEIAWKEIHEAAKSADCEVQTMREAPHLDKSKKADDKDWTVGENNGRMERQVEVLCFVTSLDIQGIRDRIAEITTHTEDIWPKYGVGVC